MRRLFLVWVLALAALLPLSWADLLLFHRGPVVAGLYQFQQDIPLLLGQGLLLLLLMASPPDPMRPGPALPRQWPLILGLGAAAVIFVVQALTLRSYGFSVDELMAEFDAQIFASGQLMARVPAAWRDYATALQPRFQLETAGHVFWASSYLPVAAAFRALGRLLGGSAWVNPAWAGLAVVAIAGLARRLWPGRPEAAIVAAVFLVTSPQLLVESMTAYSMPAHLALNLVWLWAFLRRDAVGHALALGIGFLATGLHQIVFHPLFVAPFILQLWLDRKWRVAALYTAGYAAICLFWVFYWTLAFKLLGATPQAHGPGGAWSFIGHVLALFREFDPFGAASMATDLARGLAWQNVLMVPLALLAAPFALSRPGVERCLFLGVGAMLSVVFIVMPYQDHGYGYRYLHGFLGSFCLLATATWMRCVDGLSPDGRARARSALVVASIAALALSFPFGVWKASAYVLPYARAEAALQQSGARVVFIDDDATWYVESLIRNDPKLERGPKLMKLGALTDAQVRTLCQAGGVMTFDRFDALKFGIRAVRGASPNGVPPGRVLMSELGCGGAHVTPPAI